MDIGDAQREMRTRFAGGFYGQLVSGVLWLVSASLATWSTPRAAITPEAEAWTRPRLTPAPSPMANIPGISVSM